MDVSDAHLERALKDFNEKVNALDDGGASVELAEAYLNRGCVLHMMDYRTSAIEDLETAIDMMEYLGTEGVSIDPGSKLKAFTELGCILYEEDSDPIEQYCMASDILSTLPERCAHFDRNGIVRVCVQSAEDLLDYEHPEESLPFLEHALGILQGRMDDGSANMTVHVLNLKGEAYSALKDRSSSISCYTEAIAIASGLLERESMDDPSELVMSLVSRSQEEADIKEDAQRIADLKAAIAIMEELNKMNRLDDPEVLVTLCHDLSEALLRRGDTSEAERYLVKAMRISVGGAAATREGME